MNAPMPSRTLDSGPPRAWRVRLRTLIDARPVQRLVVGLILLNAAIFGLETSSWAMATIGPALVLADKAILALFVVEIVLRIVAHGRAFFRDPWSLFDLAVVSLGLLPATSSLTALRALRVLRVLRLLHFVPELRKVVAALLGAIPGLAAIVAVLVLLFYVAAVIATKLFAATAPQWFGTLGLSLFTLFQIMTLEGWADIVRDLMEPYPFAWLFFVPFILVTTFTMLNLFIAIIVGAIERERHLAGPTEPTPASPSDIGPRLDAIAREIAQLAEAASRSGKMPRRDAVR